MTALLTGLTRPLAAWWAKRRVAQMSPGEPLTVLRSLLTQARDTEFGKAHGFSDILDSDHLYQSFIDAVPLMDYPSWIAWLGDAAPRDEKNAKPLINKGWPGSVDVYCLSSGTSSGRSKFVPYSDSMAKVNRVTALDFFAHVLQAEPQLAPPGLKTLYMSGSTNVSRNDYGSLCGDMSGLTKYLAPAILQSFTLPPVEISSLEPWSTRLAALLQLAMDHPRIGIISGIPIWQLTFLEALAEKAPISEVMPHLKVLIHGGMSMEPYRERLRQLLGDDVHFLETYAASETGITAFQVPGEAGMRFLENYGVFYEFEDANGSVFRSHEVQPGEPYAVLVSTCAGLWRYRIGDVIVFRSVNPLIMDYVARDKTTSAFDEKVTEKEVEIAMSQQAPSFSDYSVGPDIPGRRHCWFLIGEAQLGSDWVIGLDNHLRVQNQDYDDYRGDGRIQAPKAVMIPDRVAFLSCLGRIEGGQRKFPRLLSPDDVSKLLAKFDVPE